MVSNKVDMEFLVHIEISLPADLDARIVDRLRSDEAKRAGELRDADVLRSIWRIPGRTANVGIWAAADANELHDHLCSLPMFPWMDVQVTALARHPLDT
jgi:muconolactone D-isomerase